MSQIGKNIKKIRNVRGLSQQAFADLFQLSRGNISSYEEFRAEPKIEVIIKIANFFGIPLADFIEKDLSVNELLHYNTELVLETEKLKIAQQLIRVPYIPALYINDFIKQYKDEDFISGLPHIIIPSSSKFRLIAIEIDNQEALPSGYDFHNGDVLIYENIIKENVHRITDRLGMMIDPEGIKTGVYKEGNGVISLALNEWVKYPFEIESDSIYWVLRASFKQASL
ncbi:XRE family transcriptional regulator [Dysgonomonas sp. 521]|uniref:helix-turn-helix domain-containing protein n=1 Tax=Dysgonomonas sp. 521 TaxID=2302932 RepID=UPI0013D337B0|nr:helix-turn-helix transcriptional regulator [Dysgonomonas sp. 521]NDV96338.1 XRE family transcriptional regulator [Dysgonomonas sp. 521]